jgi:hypothetical protein
MQGKYQNSRIAMTTLGAAFVLFVFWIALSTLGITRDLEKDIDRALPGWFVILAVVLVPLLAGILAGPWRVISIIRYSAGVLILFSIIILEVCFRRYLWLSCAALALLLIEAYWILPKWNRSYRSVASVFL